MIFNGVNGVLEFCNVNCVKGKGVFYWFKFMLI